MPKVTFPAQNKTVEARVGESLLRVASKARVAIPQRCNGKGNCTLCKVRVSATSQVSTPNVIEQKWLSDEQLAQGMRLACQALVNGGVEVELVGNKMSEVVRMQLARQGEGIE